MTKYELDLMIVTDSNNLLKDSKQSIKEYERVKWKAYRRLSKVLQAMKLLYQHFKIVSEPGGAVAAAAAIFSKNKLKEKDIIVVVSGGNVDSEVFSKAISEN